MNRSEFNGRELRAAVIVHSAECKGSGNDPYKWVTGLTQRVLDEVSALVEETPVAILVPSNTDWQGEKYKRAIWNGARKIWEHRFVFARNFVIVGRIG